MINKEMVNKFFEQKTVAVVGVSKSGKGFGNYIFENLKKRGYSLYAVNKNGGEYNGLHFYKNISSLPEIPDAIVTVVPPQQVLKVVEEAYNCGIKNIWMQQGSESTEAIEFCKSKELNLITGHCIIMFSEPVSLLHKIHRGVLKIAGKYPA
jgi:hypothetical protein